MTSLSGQPCSVDSGSPSAWVASRAPGSASDEAGTFAVTRAFAYVEEGYRAAYRKLGEWGRGADERKKGRWKGETQDGEL